MQKRRTRSKFIKPGGSSYATERSTATNYASTWYRPLSDHQVEFMDDVVGSPQAYNPLIHVKKTPVRHSAFDTRTTNGTVRTVSGNAELLAPNDISFSLPPSLSMTEAAMKRALDQFEQQVDGRSVLTDFAEMLELKTLFKDLPNMVDSVKQILGAKALSKPLSSLVLTSELAIRPTLGMFSDYAAAIKGFNKKLKWIRKNQGKRIIQTVKGLTDTVTESGYAPIQGPSFPWSVGFSSGRQIETSSNITFEGTMLPMDDFESIYGLTVNTFKLDTPLSTAWAVVPLSFVVDWFYKVGDYLEDLEDSGIPLVTGATLRGVAHHMKISRYANTCYPGYYTFRCPASFSVPVTSELTRRVHVPSVTPSSLVGTGLSSTWRSMISAALIRARFK